MLPSGTDSAGWVACQAAIGVAKIPQVTLEMHERHGRALPLQGWAPDRRPEVVDQLADRARGLGVRGPR